MNKEKQIFKIIAFLLFVMFAAVSCWSTTESLYLTLENAQIPKWVFWCAVVGLYILTAYLTKVVLDSFNTNNDMEHRRLKFFVGLCGFIVLWLLFSMPTNSHTFFYKQMAKQTALNELQYLEGQIYNLTDTMLYLDKYQNEWNAQKNNVNAKLDQLKREINNYQQLGFGPESERILADIENLLGLQTGYIERRGTKKNTQTERNEVCKHYDNSVKTILESLYNDHLNKVRVFLAAFRDKNKVVEPILKDIKKCQDELNNPMIDKEQTLAKSRKVIELSYAILKNTFPNDYKSNDNNYKSDRLIKVTKVWGDYLAHKFRETDYTLWYWILLSVIVDLAAFTFFDIAARKDEYDF